jgi:hypothetical protein
MTMAADAIADWLRHMFGDRVVTKAADSTAIRLGAAIQSSQQSYSRKGRLLVPGTGRALSAATVPLVAPTRSARAHTFYGVRF